MNASLQLRAGQQLTMTPFLQRAIQLLPLSSLEFNQQVQDIMTGNPFLEPVGTADDPDAAGTTETGDTGDTGETDEPADPADRDGTEAGPVDAAADSLEDLWRSGAPAERAGRAGDDERDPALKVPCAPTLREHLLRQAGCLRLSDRDRMMVHAIIETIDGSGYLTQPLEELGRLCPLDPPAEDDEMRVALRHVQCLDPAGVGARSVAECLLLQLAALEPDRQPASGLARRIVERHLDLLAAHDFQRLQRELGCEAAALQAATALLRGLTPRPGAAWGADDPHFVVADVIVQARERRWVVSVNPEVIPRIHVSRFYAGLLRGSGSPVSEQLREARWLVRNIEQRFRTIRLVAQAIVDHQSRFFEHGPLAMRPLTLAEIAAKVGLHESTVSRVTSRKYMATPRGLLEFRHFFGSHVETAAGTPCSATAVRALITELIAAEDATRPLSDIRLTRLLEQRGIRVARRTVSKYRDALRIPSVEVRRMAQRPQA